MSNEHTPKRSFWPEPVKTNCVTDRTDSPCTDNVLHDVVTVRPIPSKTIDYMRDLYRSMSTAQIAAKMRNVTEAQVHNAVFGHRAQTLRSKP